MPDPRIAPSYGNRGQNDMRDFYERLQTWAPKGGPSWGPTTVGTMPPNPMEYGAVAGSREEEEMLRLILAAMGSQGAYDYYDTKRSKGSTDTAAADKSANDIIGYDLK